MKTIFVKDETFAAIKRWQQMYKIRDIIDIDEYNDIQEDLLSSLEDEDIDNAHERSTVIGRYLAGEIDDLFEVIENEVDRWHSQPSLSEWLVMNDYEYNLYLKNPDQFLLYLNNRKYNNKIL